MNGGLLKNNNNNLKLIRVLSTEAQKSILFTQEAKAIITAIKKICKEISMSVWFEYIQRNPESRISVRPTKFLNTIIPQQSKQSKD